MAYRGEVTALSGDGRVVYGIAQFGALAPGRRALACRWKAGRLRLLPLPTGIKKSFDYTVTATDRTGDVAVGTVAVGPVGEETSRAFRISGDRAELLPLPGSFEATSYVGGLADDGTIVGVANISGGRDVIWEPSGGFRRLPSFGDPQNTAQSWTISRDGRTLLANVTGRDPAAGVWRLRDSEPAEHVRPTLGKEVYLRGSSDDGRILLLSEYGPTLRPGRVIVRLRRANGVEQVLSPTGYENRDYPFPLLDDMGQVVLLHGIKARGLDPEIFIWTERTGFRTLRALLGNSCPHDDPPYVARSLTRSSSTRIVIVGSTLRDSPFRAEISL